MLLKLFRIRALFRTLDQHIGVRIPGGQPTNTLVPAIPLQNSVSCVRAVSASETGCLLVTSKRSSSLPTRFFAIQLHRTHWGRMFPVKKSRDEPKRQRAATGQNSTRWSPWISGALPQTFVLSGKLPAMTPELEKEIIVGIVSAFFTASRSHPRDFCRDLEATWPA